MTTLGIILILVATGFLCLFPVSENKENNDE